MLGFYVPPTAKVIRRQDLGLKSHPKDWRDKQFTTLYIRGLSKKFVEFVNKKKTTIPIAFKFVWN